MQRYTVCVLVFDDFLSELSTFNQINLLYLPCARPDFYLLFDCFPQAQKALSEKNKGGYERLSSKNKYIEELEVAEKTKRQELKKGLLMRFRINVSIRLRFDVTIFMQRSPRSFST